MFDTLVDDQGRLTSDVQFTGTGMGVRSSVAAGLTAAGTNQATALALTTDISEFTTVASGTGAIIRDAAIGRNRKVKNRGANALLLYPPVGHSFDGGAANASVSIAVGGYAIIDKVTATRWVTGELVAA